MFKPSITKNISIILAFVIMTIFCTNSSVYARKNNSIEIISNNIIQVRENNKISTIEIVEDNSSTRTVIQKNANDDIIEVYTYDKIRNQINTSRDSDIINSINSRTKDNDLISQLAWEGGSGCTVGDTRTAESARISYGDLLQAAGVVVSLATLISLIAAATGGATIVVQDIYKAIKKEVIALTAGVSGFFLKNHGIIIYREETCERRCRGTDCYTTYYAEATGHSTY